MGIGGTGAGVGVGTGAGVVAGVEAEGAGAIDAVDKFSVEDEVVDESFEGDVEAGSVVDGVWSLSGGCGSTAGVGSVSVRLDSGRSGDFNESITASFSFGGASSAGFSVEDWAVFCNSAIAALISGGHIVLFTYGGTFISKVRHISMIL